MEKSGLRTVLVLTLLAVVAEGRFLFTSDGRRSDVSQFVVSAPLAVVTSESAARSRVRRQVPDHGMTAKQIQQVVDLHNHYRAIPLAANMRAMVWNDDLARMALDWGQQCRWEHGQPDFNLYPDVKAKYPFGLGQNLFTTFSVPNRTIEENIKEGNKGWYDEVKDYNFDTNSCNSGAVCGHYTQMVWADSYELGCANLRCPRLVNIPNFFDAFYLICNYGPPGNFVGQRPYRSGSPCSQCPADAPFCVNKTLCSAETTTTPPTTTPPTTTPPTTTPPTATPTTTTTILPISSTTTSETPTTTTTGPSTTTPANSGGNGPTAAPPVNGVCAPVNGSNVLTLRGRHYCGFEFSTWYRQYVARKVNSFCRRRPRRCCKSNPNSTRSRRTPLPSTLQFTTAMYICHDKCPSGGAGSNWRMRLKRMRAIEAPNGKLCATWRGEI